MIERPAPDAVPAGRGGGPDQALVPLADAQAFVLGLCPRLVPTMTPVSDALGLVLAKELVASEAVPPFANTAMDGYAVRAGDTAEAPIALTVIGTLAAGHAWPGHVGAGEALRIMTGAPIPAGADAVVPVEQTLVPDGGSRVMIHVAASVGDHVRPAGEDVGVGQPVFEASTALGPGHLGVLASLGFVKVPVIPRARVGVVSTGDELVEGGATLRAGQIRDSNRPTLLAMVAEAGGEGIDLGIVGDDADALADAISDAARRCDALLTSGGVSVGDFDYVKVVLDRLSGGTMRWMQVGIRPAKPFAFGRVGGVPVFGLPGNPVSSMVSFECFARPALRQMMGHQAIERPRVQAVADEPLGRHRDGKVHFLRVLARWLPGENRFHVRLSGGQGSNLLRSMAQANGLAVLPDGDGVDAGRAVDTMLFGPLM